MNTDKHRLEKYKNIRVNLRLSVVKIQKEAQMNTDKHRLEKYKNIRVNPCLSVVNKKRKHRCTLINTD